MSLSWIFLMFGSILPGERLNWRSLARMISRRLSVEWPGNGLVPPIIDPRASLEPRLRLLIPRFARRVMGVEDFDSLRRNSIKYFVRISSDWHHLHAGPFG